MLLHRTLCFYVVQGYFSIIFGIHVYYNGATESATPPAGGVADLVTPLRYSPAIPPGEADA